MNVETKKKKAGTIRAGDMGGIGRPAGRLKAGNILQSFRKLTGNTRVSVVFEPLWGIAFALYNFYLSLYMKSLGVTDRQVGYLISLGFIFSAVFSFFGGIITDRLGRKRTTLIFDLISWPGSIILYLISGGFWLCALATVVNSTVRIVAVSWNLMVVEDADHEQQVAAYNLLSAINISMGIFTPVAGLLVRNYGIITAERLLMAFAVISMTAMMILRNRLYTETKVGRQILNEHREMKERGEIRINPYKRTFSTLRENPGLVMILMAVILFNSYIPIGTYNSLYFAPYLTEVLKLDKSAISILGGVNSLVIFLVLVLILPGIGRENRFQLMICGLLLQALSQIFFVIMPRGSFLYAAISLIIFAVGFGLTRPFLESVFAAVSEGRERAGIYAVSNMMISVTSAVLGFASGYLYSLRPELIYVLSFCLLMVCTGFLTFFSFRNRNSFSGTPGVITGDRQVEK